MKEKIFLITGLFLASVCLLIIFNCNTKTLAISSSSNQVIAQVGNTNNSNNSNNTNTSGTSTVTTDFGNATNLGSYVSLIITWATPFLGGVALLMMIYAGYLYMTSQGNPDSINKAKDIILSTIVGIVLLFTIALITRQIGIH